MAFENILIAAAVFAASVLQGMFGFAFMLVALPLAALIIPLREAVPLLSLFLALISGILAFRMRGTFDLRDVRPLILGAVLGIPVGIMFLMGSNDRIIRTTLGLILVLYAAYALLVRQRALRLPAWTGYLFGFLAGALGGAFNITGPAVVLHMSTQDWSKATTVGSLNIFFCVTSAIIVAFHVAAGNITGHTMLAFLGLIPAMLAGMYAGIHFLKSLDEERYRKGLFIILIIMGLVLLR